MPNTDKNQAQTKQSNRGRAQPTLNAHENCDSSSQSSLLLYQMCSNYLVDLVGILFITNLPSLYNI
jgi:hypothetical protein